jgi:hypothetical protein
MAKNLVSVFKHAQPYNIQKFYIHTGSAPCEIHSGCCDTMYLKHTNVIINCRFHENATAVPILLKWRGVTLQNEHSAQHNGDSKHDKLNS